MGVILFTYAAGFALQLTGWLLSQWLQHLRQGPQAVRVKHRASSSHLAKRVAFGPVRPSRWYPLQIPRVVLEKQKRVDRSALLLDQVELPATVGMERMGDAEPARLIRWNGCNHSGTCSIGCIGCIGCIGYFSREGAVGGRSGLLDVQPLSFGGRDAPAQLGGRHEVALGGQHRPVQSAALGVRARLFRAVSGERGIRRGVVGADAPAGRRPLWSRVARGRPGGCGACGGGGAGVGEAGRRPN